VASIMHQADLPVTAAYNDVDPAATPNGRGPFARNRDGGDFKIYAANVFTGEVQRVTDNAMDDRNPAWPAYGKNIIYEAE
jgi:Tol biopolymer transport system component